MFKITSSGQYVFPGLFHHSLEVSAVVGAFHFIRLNKLLGAENQLQLPTPSIWHLRIYERCAIKAGNVYNSFCLCLFQY